MNAQQRKTVKYTSTLLRSQSSLSNPNPKTHLEEVHEFHDLPLRLLTPSHIFESNGHHFLANLLSGGTTDTKDVIDASPST